MNVLILGSNGYIGSALTQYLHRQGEHALRCFDTNYFGNSNAGLDGVEHIQGDIRDYKAVERACSGMDAVVTLAGVVTDELVDMNPGFGQEVNVDGTLNVVRAAIANNVDRLVYASSSSVYGATAIGGTPSESDQPYPITKYAAQKLTGEEIVLTEFKGQSRIATAVRQATAMGPAPRMRLDTVVNIFSKQAFYDGVITPFGGEQYRSNVHVQDVVRFYDLLLTDDRVGGRPWNLTQGNFTVAELAERTRIVAESEGIEATVEYKDVEDLRSYRLDGRAVEKELGFVCARTVTDAVRDNLNWFQSGAIDPNDPIYRNNARMGDLVTKGE